MAFDHPLEADRVDDLGLFSVFLRAPVVGTIMWMIGGDMAKQRDEEDKVKQELLHDTEGGVASATLNRGGISPLTDSRRCVETSRGTKKLPPGLLGSDISHFGDFATEQEAAVLQETQVVESEKGSSLKRAKKMSWSDESGQSLFVYINDAQDDSDGRDSSKSSPVSPAPSTGVSTTTKPVKSAIRRSRSARADAGSSGASRLAPKGFCGGSNGLVMPTKPFGVSSNGAVSPEWGWYINTTPPTPEMYHSRRPSQKTGTDAALTTQELERCPPKQTGIPPELTPLSNPAFGRSKRAAVGWPSVPM